MTDRYLITGGAGFIGSALVRHIIGQTQNSVLVIDKLTYASNLKALADVSGNVRYAFIKADIQDAAKMREVFAEYRPRFVIHLAAESHVDRSIDGPGDFIFTNVVGTYTLLQAALEYWRALAAPARDAFRFHHVSTDEVFGSLGPEGHFDETTRYSPNSPYSASKAASDHLVRAWHHTYGLPTVVSNCSNNYGQWQFPEKLIPLMILNALELRPLPVYGDGGNIRDWLHVDDHVRALLAVATAGRIGETYCIGGLSERTNLDVAKAICALADAHSPANAPHDRLITFVPDRPGHDLRYAIAPDKIRQELNWRPQETFETGLSKTFDWYCSNRTWWEEIRSTVYSGDRLGILV